MKTADFKLFLMAILGIQGNKRMGVANPKASDKKQENGEKDHLQYGWINEQSHLCFDDQDIKNVSAKFSVLNMNRINFKGEVINKKKQETLKNSSYSFKPNLEKSSRSIKNIYSSSQDRSHRSITSNYSKIQEEKDLKLRS